MNATPDSKPTDDSTPRWKVLAARAQFLKKIRQFFDQRNFLEVETPILGREVGHDTGVNPFAVSTSRDKFYLQTSPELYMKRLLAQGSPPIYQLARCFRQDEQGPWHNLEFTLLEWYAPHTTYHQLMHQVQELLQTIIPNLEMFHRRTYRQAFLEFADLDPFEVSDDELTHQCEKVGYRDEKATRDDQLNILLSHRVEPALAGLGPTFLYDYPASQSALAQIRKQPQGDVAERFELYVQGIELCNGYQELTDVDELRRRFAQHQADRQAQNLPTLPDSQAFFKAHEVGLPPCAGVALGVDRLIALALGQRNIASVLAFPSSEA